MEFITIPVERREKSGTHDARRGRRDGRVPAVLYGLGRQNATLTITRDAFATFLKTGSRLVELRLGDKTQQAILRAVQHDPLTDEVLHIDLLRVDKDHEIEARVPVEFKGIPKGLAEGGIFEPVLSDVVVRSTPARLPKLLLVDVSGLRIDDAIHVKDLPLPEGVVVLGHKPDDHVAHCVTQRVAVLETTPAEGATAEPERIGGKKPEEDAEGEDAAKPAKRDEKKDEKKDKK